MIHSHPSLVCWTGALLLALVGIQESRSYPDKAWMACSNWLLALLLVSGDMIWLPLGKGVPALSIRPVLGALIFVVGVTLVGTYYFKHRSP